MIGNSSAGGIEIACDSPNCWLVGNTPVVAVGIADLCK